MIRSNFACASRVLAAALVCAVSGCSDKPPDRVEGHFHFEKDALTFANFDLGLSGAELTAPQAARMFGDAAVCASGAGDTCEPTSIAKTWLDDTNAGFEFGHSEGMAVMTALLSIGKVDASTLGGANAAALPFTSPVRAEISYWAATQKVLAVHADDRKLSANEVLPFLAKELPRDDEAWRLLIAIKGQGGFTAGHGLVPFGYFKGEQPGQYFVRVYDPSFPSEERRIELNVEANTWVYEGSTNPDFPRHYEGTTENGNKLFFSPVTKRLGTLTPPFTEGFSASANGGPLLVKDESAGTMVGFRNGDIVEENGTFLPSSADCFCKPPSTITNVMVKGSGPQTISVAGDGGTIYATSPTMATKVDSTSGAGAMTVDPTTRVVTFNSTGDAGTTITNVTLNPDGSQTTTVVSVSNPSTTIRLDSSDPANVKLTVDANPQGGTVITVETTVTQPDGTSKTTVASGTTNGNDALITVNAVDGGAQVNTAINYATCKNVTKDPMESDVDCGAFCSMQGEKNGDGRCAEKKYCSTNDDCTSWLECFNNRCEYPTCSDGVKNGGEIAVDCGSARGCRCTTGQPCDNIPGAGHPRCNADNLCINDVCVATVPFTATIVGLGSNLVRVPVTSDGSSYTLDLTGTGAPSFTKRFVAATSLTVSKPLSLDFDCVWSTRNATGDWAVPTVTSPANNTLTCTRKRAEVHYSVTGACESEVNVTPPNSGVTRVWELRPYGPSVTLTSLSPSVSAAPYAQIAYPGSNYNAGSLTTNGPLDGGTVWQVVVGGPTEGFANYRYNMIDPGPVRVTSPRRFKQTCAITGTDRGPFPLNTPTVQIACTCEDTTPPPPMDGGTTGGDGGTNTDGGTSVDAGPGGCSRDSDCGSGNDCFCGANSGSCAGAGVCGAGRFFSHVGTSDGITPSGTFTVPTGCNSVRVAAWGAAGGGGLMSTGFGPNLPTSGGAGGYVGGSLAVTPGEVITVWVGNAGVEAQGTPTARSSIGSNVGVAANGGAGDSTFVNGGGGAGGGLTSLKVASSGGTTRLTFSVPAGGGGSSFPGYGGGDASNSGGAAGASGGAAAMSSFAGGGGAGDPGGTAGSTNNPGKGGAFGTLPGSLTGAPGGFDGLPSNRSVPDYAAFCGSAGDGNQSSNNDGCVVLRCEAP